MPLCHVIRLAGPWELDPLARFVPSGPTTFREETHDLPPGGKTQVPGDWTAALGDDFRGRVRYTRRFNCPTNLDASERVWLVCDGVAGTAQIALNGQPIFALKASGRAGSCDVTPHLLPHNALTVEVSAPPGGPAGGITGEVRLEIRGG